MAIVTIGFSRAHLLHLINRTLRGEEIIIARGSKPVVRLVAIDPLIEEPSGSANKRHNPRRL